MDTSHIEILQSSLLFRGMSREEIEEVAEKIPSRVKTFEKGDFIARDGEELSYMAIILKGRVHLFHIDPDGNNNLLEALGPGEAAVECLTPREATDFTFQRCVLRRQRLSA